MKGSDILNQLRDNAKKLPGAEPTAQVTLKDDPPPEPDDGTIEAPDRCGVRNGKYAQQGFVLETTDGQRIGIAYSSIISTIKWLEPSTIEFFFEDTFLEDGKLAQATFQVLITGTDAASSAKAIKDFQLWLTGQKWEIMNPGAGNTIKRITIERIPDGDSTED